MDAIVILHVDFGVAHPTEHLKPHTDHEENDDDQKYTHHAPTGVDVTGERDRI